MGACYLMTGPRLSRTEQEAELEEKIEFNKTVKVQAPKNSSRDSLEFRWSRANWDPGETTQGQRVQSFCNQGRKAGLGDQTLEAEKQ